MYTLLVFAVLLTVLLAPVAASNPAMTYAMSDTPLDTPYFDSEDIFNPLCEYCAIPFFQCVHAIPQAPYVAARMLYPEPEPYSPLPDHHQTQADLTPLFEYVTEAPTQPLMNENIRYMDANETTVTPTTVQAHILDTYTPGDRLQTRRPRSRKATHRRQAPRRGGFSCDIEGCDRAFDRQCELNRHQKTHLDPSERPHKCPSCNNSFLYPKDLHRHQRKHSDQSSAEYNFRCTHPSCVNLDGFTRKDNLLRHQRKRHPAMAALS